MSREKTDISAMDSCKNLAESYGEICVKCNKCGRFDEQKQIEEMADILCEAKEHDCNGGNDCLCIKQSQALYNAGYRKQNEVIVEIVDEFKQIVKQFTLDRGLYLVVFKNALDYAEAELKKKYVGININENNT